MNERKNLAIFDVVTALLCLMLLTTLAMPFLLNARSQSARAKCSDNLRKIGLAAHSYESAHRKFPAGTLGHEFTVEFDEWNDISDSETYWKTFQNTSSLATLMPFLELDEQFRSLPEIMFKRDSNLKGHFEWQGALTGVDKVMVEQVEGFLCPEDNLSEFENLVMIASQPCKPADSIEMDSIDANGDIAIRYWPTDSEEESDTKLALTNYLGCFGVTGEVWSENGEMRAGQGIMSPRSKVMMRDVQDGLSNTIMYGETLGEINDSDRKSASSWMWGGGARIIGHWPLNAEAHPDFEDVPMLGNETFSSGVGFGSKHDGVVLFGFADGSIHEINIEVDSKTLILLSGCRDGEVVPEF